MEPWACWEEGEPSLGCWGLGAARKVQGDSGRQKVRPVSERAWKGNRKRGQSDKTEQEDRV